MTEYAKKVKTELIKRDMTLKDLAEAISQSRAAVYKTLKGDNNCPGTEKKINEYLGIRSKK